MLRMKWITVHCSASTPNDNYDMRRLYEDHVIGNGWSDVGYHFLITRDGVVHEGRPVKRTGAHVRNHNRGNIGICLAGGVDKYGRPEFNFTPEQMGSLRDLIINLIGIYGVPSPPMGHRDWSPDLNGDGIIQANERIKECPCFDVAEWWKSVTE